jgi:ArsR family transcriptional regulator
VCGAQAAFFETLGNEGRLYLLHALRDGPKAVSELVESTRMEQTHVSHNLKRLEAFGFVVSERKGKFNVYRLNMQMEPLTKLIDPHVRAHCADKAKPCCCATKH